MATATAELLSIEEFLALPDSSEYELIDGELKERCMAFKPAWVATRFSRELYAFAPAVEMGLIVGDGAPLAIFPARPRYAPRPDGLFISFERLGSRIGPTAVLTVPPELVIEVVSPHDVASDVEGKALAYLGAGVDTVWVAYPEQRTIHVYRRAGPFDLLTDGDILRGDGPLTGLEIAVSALFGERTDPAA
ncbi:MAG: Uma2 family endonuclease [Dehalococcoidia bacterium]